jgi:hypothetical protein
VFPSHAIVQGIKRLGEPLGVTARVISATGRSNNRR